MTFGRARRETGAFRWVTDSFPAIRMRKVQPLATEPIGELEGSQPLLH